MLDVRCLRLDAVACQDMHDAYRSVEYIRDMRLVVRIVYTGQQGRGPVHIFGRKLIMTVLNMHAVICRFQKVRQTEYNSIEQ